MHQFIKEDIKVSDAFIDKFAQMYVSQRTIAVTSALTLTATFLFKTVDFDTTELEKIIRKKVVAEDWKREHGIKPEILNDIYRSDLGELLLTYFFEEKQPVNERFTIPLKNISFRELSNMPGRGMDAIGYRLDGSKIHLLFGESKVSESKTSPPHVVHTTDDSIYKTQLNRRGNKSAILERLTDYYRRLGNNDAKIIGMAIWAIENDLDDHFEITFGCTLIRDYSCVNETTDFGKMKSEVKHFERHQVSFALLSFLDKSISETVDLFYKKVKEKVA